MIATPIGHGQQQHTLGGIGDSCWRAWLAPSCVIREEVRMSADVPISIAPAVEPAMIDRRALGPFLAGWESCCTGEEAISAVSLMLLLARGSWSSVDY